MAAKKTARTRGGFKASRHGTGAGKSKASAAGDKAAQKRAAEARESKSPKVGTKAQSTFLRGKKIDPRKLDGTETVVQLVEGAFQSYNSGRLREACGLFTELMLQKEVTVGMTLTGALTPAGLGMSTIIPLMEAGFVDWIISTGANLYHDAHFGLGLSMHRGNPQASDTVLREEGVVRIYDVFFDYDVLLSTDAFFRKVIRAPEFQRSMSSAEFHHLCGKYLVEREKALGIPQKSLLAAAYRCGVPIYTSSPGDSSIGMNVAALALEGGTCVIDPNKDVNETASIVLHAKRTGGQSAVLIAGGGSPKNFALQTEPQIQEVLGIDEKGHDYFLQITDARPDTGGLSGATPAEAVSWGKIDPDKLPDAVVCYLDSTIALPILTSYALAKRKPRKLKRLYDKRAEMMATLQREFAKANH
jgi:deoxyhypusine synthase